MLFNYLSKVMSLNLVVKTRGVSCLLLLGLLASDVLDSNENSLTACFISLAG